MSSFRCIRFGTRYFALFLLLSAFLAPFAFAGDGVEGPFQNCNMIGPVKVAGPYGSPQDGHNTCKTACGDPIDASSGEQLYERTDLVLPGMIDPLAISFQYRSRRAYNSRWGYDWYFPYEMRLFRLAGGDVQWRIGTGEEKTFIKSGSVFTPPADHHVTLTQQVDGSWILQEKGGVRYFFSVEGLLTQIVDRANNTIQFLYATDAFGAKTRSPIAGSSGNIVALDYRLEEIISTLGTSVHFTYFGSSDGAKNGRLKTTDDDFGRLVSYDYDSAGNLITVTSPSSTFEDNTGALVTRGRVTTFAYSSGFKSVKPGAPEDPRDHNLLTITDDRGLVQLSNQYGVDDRVISQDFNGATTTFTYTISGTGTVSSVDEIDNNGYVHRRTFDTNGNLTSEKTQGSGIHSGISTSSFYGETYTYDASQQVTEIRQQLGNGVEFTYDAQGNLLERRMKTSVTAANNAADIVSSYTYEPQFNQVKTATDPLGFVTTYFYDYEEASLGDKNGDGLTNQTAGNLVRVDLPNALLPDGTTQSGISYQMWFNSYGQLIRTIDAESNVVERQYYPSGNPSFGLLYKVIGDPAGLAVTTEYTYDTYGFLATVKDARNNTTTFTANALGELKEITAPLNAGAKRTYDANGNVVKAEIHNVDDAGTAGSPEWIKSVQVYDTWNRLTSIVEDLSSVPSLTTRTTTLEYDGLSNLKRVTSPEGRVDTYEYDENGLGWRTNMGVGSSDAMSTALHVDGNWRVTQSLDGRGKITTVTYDLFDRITKVTDPASNDTQMDWDKRGQVTERRQYNGASTLATKVVPTYDSLGRMTKNKQVDVTNSSSISESWFEFNKNSIIKKVRSPRGYFTTYAYDALNRRTSSTDAMSNSASWTMDANGNPLTITEVETESSETYVSHMTWDALDRLSTRSSVDRLASSHEPLTTYGYDSRSQVVQVTDAIGRTSRTTYDLAGRATETNADTTGIGVLTRYGYDKDDLMTSLLDADSNTTTWSYDSLGRKVRATYPTGVFEEWTYDRTHNVQTYRTQDGVVTSSDYHANNLLKSRATAGLLEEFTWNGFHAPLSAKVTRFGTVTSNVTFAYDGFGRLASETQDSYAVGFAYDADHNPTQLTYPGPYSTTQSFDALDRLSGVSDVGGTIAAYTFAGPGRAQTRTTGVTQTLAWDGLRRLAGIQSGVNLDLAYGFDDVNRRTYRENVHAAGRGDVYGYDSVSRLKDVWYDAANPSAGSSGFTTDFHVTQSKVEDRTSTTANSVVTNYNAADSLHRYTQIGATTRSFDAKGNLTDDGTQLFEFDAWNRLAKVSDKSTGVERARYEFDALGRRTKKIETGLTTRYVYAGARLLAEYEDTGGGLTLKRRYIYGAELDEALAVESNGVRYWAYQDALGSTEVITDLSNIVVERYTYDTFGQPTVQDGAGVPIVGAYGRAASSVKNALWFTGARFDSESGQYHMRARQYEPLAGRFVSRDPLGYIDGPNPYTYGFGAPTNWTDPFGLEAGPRKRTAKQQRVLEENLKWANVNHAIARMNDKSAGDYDTAYQATYYGNWALATVATAGTLSYVGAGAKAAQLGYRGVEVARNTYVAVGVRASRAYGTVAAAAGAGWLKLKDGVAAAPGWLGDKGRRFLDATTRLRDWATGRAPCIDKVNAKEVPELGRKLEFFFGNATGSVQNLDRTGQMLSQLKRIGLWDDPTTRQYLTEHLTRVLNNAANIVRVQDNGRVVRESLLMGPGGMLKLETIWEANKLITANLFGGP